MPIITDEDLISELRAALAWALEQIEDSLDLDHQAALAGARKLLEE